ncbi:MAG: hypothetical protein ACE5FA_03160 [Dehalococcoidia bacterium]
MTDVGGRCPTCAPARKLPQLELSPLHLARAVAAAAVSGVVLGVLWGYLLPGTFGFFSIFIGMGIGWAVSEPVSVATNRKSGTPLQIVAALGVALAYVVRNIVDTGVIIQTGDISGYIALVVGIVVAVNRLRF